jgi:hypothetical protein
MLIVCVMQLWHSTMSNLIPEASAFSTKFDPENYEDLTLLKVDEIHKVRHQVRILFVVC